MQDLRKYGFKVAGRAPQAEDRTVTWHRWKLGSISLDEQIKRNADFNRVIDHAMQGSSYHVKEGQSAYVKDYVLPGETYRAFIFTQFSFSSKSVHVRYSVKNNLSDRVTVASIKAVSSDDISLTFNVSDIYNIMHLAVKKCDAALKRLVQRKTSYEDSIPSVDQIWEQAREKANHKNQRGVFKVFINLSDDTLDCIKMLKRGSVIQQDDLFIVTTLNVKTAEDLRKLMLKNPKVLKAWNDA
jgi:hypothetical protein